MSRGEPVVLCVDDDGANLELLQRTLRSRFPVIVATSGAEALELTRAHEIAVVLTDVRMPEMSGPELLRQISEVAPLARRVIVTGYPDADDLIPAINGGKLDHVVTKPWRPSELANLVGELVELYRGDSANRQLLSRLADTNSELVSKERQLREALDQRGHDLSEASQRLLEMGSRIEALSFRDDLTGLYNHRAFHDRVLEELNRAERYATPVALVMIDIDGFATFNREHGHAAGDRVLQGLAQLISETADGHRNEVASRFSGEEFALLLLESNKAAALSRAMRLRDVIANTPLFGDHRVSVSIGVAAYPDDATEGEALLMAAESAIKGAKRAGPGRVHFFDGSNRRRERRQSASITTVSMSAPEVDRFRPVHERLVEINTILQRDRAVSCLYIDLTRLRRIEQELGLAHHSQVFDRAGAELDNMRGTVLKSTDLICRTAESDAYVVILGARGSKGQDLHALAGQVQAAAENALRTVSLELMHDNPRITVGWARVLSNSMVRSERLDLSGSAAGQRGLDVHRAGPSERLR